VIGERTRSAVVTALVAVAAGMLGLLATGFPVAAQPPGKVYRVGVLCGTACGGPLNEAFRHRLRERGWLEGQTVTIEYRAAGGQYERLPELAAELLKLNVDVLVGSGPTSALAVVRASTSVPVVFLGLGDPVRLGIVQSLAHPGGNATGLTYTPSYEYWGKLLELLKAAVPAMQRVGVVSDLQEDRPLWWPELERAAKALTVQLAASVRVRGPETFQDAIAELKDLRVDGVIVTMASTTYVHRRPLAEQLLRARLPSIGLVHELPEAGGLLSYGVDLRAVFLRLADYVDRILRGTKPGELPVEQPAKFNLVINRKTARALGMKIPQRLQLMADQVIE
jgi:putative ABC transport system substrate-binding protein